MIATPHRARGLVWAGLAAGPAAWAINTQLDYAVAPLDCSVRVAVLLPSAVFFLLVAVAGAWWSWRFLSRAEITEDWSQPAGGRPHLFLGIVGFAAGILFALVLANQIAAIALVDGCLR